MTTFAPSEIEPLRHRLEVFDRIAEALADDENDEIADIAVNDPHRIHFVTLQLMGELQIGKSVEYLVALAQREPLGGAVLRDAVERSTYLSSMPDDPEEAPRRRAAV